MPDLALSTVIQALRAELESAISEGHGQHLRFDAKEIVVELQVGVTKEADAKVGAKFWVVELGAGGSLAHESIQKVTLSLEPITSSGQRIRISDDADESPLKAQ